MAHATDPFASNEARGQSQSHHPGHHAPVTPGKVAMWLFLATEVMFFTGLIGSYIVLRSGSPSTAYSNLYPPATNLRGLENTFGVYFRAVGVDHTRIEEALRSVASLTPEAAAKLAEEAHEGSLVNALTENQAVALSGQLRGIGVEAEVKPLETHHWPKPYDELTNPLSIDLTALNTFILICSSVTMVLALSAIQQGNRGRCSFFLGATVVIGSIFLGIQVFEYYELMFGRHYTPGISPTGHFRPDVSLFASCFFTMTGFHGAHVTGGVITLLIIFVQSLRGVFSQTHYNPIEFAGLYWHFVDLVWIILFTIVYLI
jgi:cytochrome c oxidase subunit 3